MDKKKITKELITLTNLTSKLLIKNHTSAKINNPVPDVTMVTKNTSKKVVMEKETLDPSRMN